jgi:1-acyl-sn-glycerol-3-phosphate acyltransferase
LISPNVTIQIYAIISRILLAPVAKLRIDDLPAQTPPQGYLIVVNHRSIIDILVGLVAFRKWDIVPHMFIRANFLSMPVVGAVLRQLNMIPVGRSDISAARNGLEILRSGHPLLITPEGRIPHEEDRINGIANLRPGFARLATAAGVRILLVGMVNTDQVWKLGAFFPKLHLDPRRRPVIRISAEWFDIGGLQTELHVCNRVRAALSEILMNLECMDQAAACAVEDD